MKSDFTGWLLDREERRQLLQEFRPAYADVIADHVTLESPSAAVRPSPPDVDGRIVGVVDDHKGVQALVVEIDGTTHRPDGGTFHITWSIDRKKGRKPVHSNDALAHLGWNALPAPRRIRLLPKASH
ncbi:MAG: hypothetical protein AB7E79_01455 [Rhodospirillaceae bacterium]